MNGSIKHLLCYDWFFSFSFVVWLKEDTLAGICYLYLLNVVRKSKNEGEGKAWRRGRSGASEIKKNKSEGRPKNVYNPTKGPAILVEQNNS